MAVSPEAAQLASPTHRTRSAPEAPLSSPHTDTSGMDRLAALRAFYDEDPDDPFTRFALAQEHLKRSETDEALAFFEALVRDHPDYVGTYYHLGALYAHLGRDDDARQTYRDGIVVATRANDLHARAELQSALLEAEGLGFE
ncbi:MAG: tetratricopeptide repeat protein [Bacteroidota bacterium]